jgi:methylenetetrahydrofolate reductase (NADPH)
VNRYCRPVIAVRRRPAGAARARAREILARALAQPTFELLPVKSAESQIPFIPPGAWVAITASPARGIEATVELALRLEAAGYRAIPHLAARMIRDQAHLQWLLDRLTAGGVTRAFVIGGDASEPGEYPDGLSLLRAIADLGTELTEVGIPCYPEGHPFVPDEVLLESLAAKAGFATFATTQLCFDAPAISSWIAARRSEGLALPIQIGVAGPVEAPRLLAISARLGVRDTSRFIVKNLRFVTRLLRTAGHYRPDSLLDQLAPLYGDPVADVRWVHLYTFNQVEATERWRHRYIARLLAVAPG